MEDFDEDENLYAIEGREGAWKMVGSIVKEDQVLYGYFQNVVTQQHVLLPICPFETILNLQY